jgi:hypothetical protein
MIKRHVKLKALVTDRLRYYGAAMKVIGNADVQESGRWLNNRAANSYHSVPTARAGQAAVPRYAHHSEVQRGPCLRPQPLQPGTPPLQPRYLQKNCTLPHWHAVMG